MKKYTYRLFMIVSLPLFIIGAVVVHILDFPFKKEKELFLYLWNNG